MAIQQLRSSFDRLIALWVLRAFSRNLGRSCFISGSDYSDHDIAEFLGLPTELDQEILKKMPRLLDVLQASLEKGKTSLPALARNNFKRFAASLKLNAVEQSILEFFACSEIKPPLTDTSRVIRKINEADTPRYLSQILDTPRSLVAKAMSPSGRLMKCGLIKKCDNPRRYSRLEFHSETLANTLLQESYDQDKLMKLFGVVTPPTPELGLEDFPHIQTTLDLLIPYLRKVQSTHRPGVNILIHGAPGTGKSQLVRVLARSLDIPVFELDTSDNEGDPLCDSQRLSVLNLAQTYFSGNPALLVFDEAEDILTPTLTNRGAANTHKGWFNQMLENNHRPVFWISNSIETLDPAFSRRFDFVLELPIPPKSQRARILKENVGQLVSPELIENLASIEHLAPAVVTRARNVIHTIRRDIPKGDRDAALTHVIAGVLKAQGHPNPARSNVQAVQPGIYDIDHLNTSADLPQIAANLKENPSARLCLYGPPGTGKTSFGHWLAHEIDQPLLLRKASDLLGPFVGMTEQKIARTFETAKQEGAILLIDEVDSFLRDRTQTRHSWEVTQINEMLTQIESFPGILIASTNLIDQLDPASMRRFDIKLHFGYLLPEQACRLFASYCEKLSLPQPSHAELEMAATMELSTPGDFAAVARQHRFQPFRDANGLLQSVIAESELKTNCSRRIGFQ
ncbi:MAG: AAA family ATPase [Luteolibacter sp.]